MAGQWGPLLRTRYARQIRPPTDRVVVGTLQTSLRQPHWAFPAIVAGTATSPEVSLWVFDPKNVRRGKFVPMLAVRFARIHCARASPTAIIFAHGNRLKMSRVDTRPDTAKMIDRQFVRNRANKCLVGNAMSFFLLPIKGHRTVALCFFDRTLPEPATTGPRNRDGA